MRRPSRPQCRSRRPQTCQLVWGMAELQRLAVAHLGAVLEFERQNRAYFARSLSDRGDESYAALAEHHQTLLGQQDAGPCVLFVLMDHDGSILGRFNRYDLDDSAARVGYRVAERATGRGTATRALTGLCRKARRDSNLRTLSAERRTANRASQRVLEKIGFVSTELCVVAGKPGRRFTLS